MSSLELNKRSLSSIAAEGLALFNRYAILLFVLLLSGVYGFVAFKLLTAHNAQPSDQAISAQVQTTATPHVDPKVVEQMQSLQDHSVNVKTLFDQARSNPFQE